MTAHFIILRRDLPLGVALAMTTHAAGESAFLTWKLPSDTTAIVLGVDSEEDLIILADKLADAGIEQSLITESDPPWNGQLMAIGIVPGERSSISPLLAHLRLLKELSYPRPDSALKSNDDFNGRQLDFDFQTPIREN